MKKIFTIMVMWLMQQPHASAQITCGFTGGIVTSTYVIKESGVRVSAGRKIGFTAGVFAQGPIAGQFHLQTGANFVQKGYKITDPEYNEKDKQTVNCIEVPLNILYKMNSSKMDIVFGAGPSLSFAISGKDKYDSELKHETTKLKFGNSADDDMRGMDIGANIVAGIQMKSRLMVMANYNFGLSNLIPKDANVGGKTKFRSNYISLKLGYAFKAH
jgi:hypothetical protein